MSKRVITGIAGCVVIAALLLVVSPPSCGCETPAMAFAWELEMFTPPNYALPEDLTPERILVAAKNKFIGVDRTKFEPPTSLRGEPCRQVSGQMLACSYWLETGILRQQGVKLIFVADSAGKISNVLLQETHRWFGRYESVTN